MIDKFITSQDVPYIRGLTVHLPWVILKVVSFQMCFYISNAKCTGLHECVMGYILLGLYFTCWNVNCITLYHNLKISTMILIDSYTDKTFHIDTGPLC